MNFSEASLHDEGNTGLTQNWRIMDNGTVLRLSDMIFNFNLEFMANIHATNSVDTYTIMNA